MTLPLSQANTPQSYTKIPWYSVLLFVVGVACASSIWLQGNNYNLFLLINHYHILLPNWFWEGLNFISYSRYFILPAILLLVTWYWRRQQLLNVAVVIILYYLIFALLKHMIGEARPYVVLDPTTFFWLNHFENTVKSAYLSFPSGHTGNMAVFAFSLNVLFFANKKGLQFLMLGLVSLTALARVCTGWHWPLDVISSAILGYVLVKVSFALNLARIQQS